ncbi:MAG: DEAD/DEAH box helicase family protein [Gammaproteobacteria bacterium]|nr:DEAD/DEAH box helicase family protein [Gammaproteobacteria bacterium]
MSQKNIDHEKKIKILEAALQEINEQNPYSSDGSWLEDLTTKVGSMLHEWDMEGCVAWKDWEERSEIFLGLDAQDIGIDLVGKRASNQYIAIQCKARKLEDDGSGTQISKQEIDSFMSVSQDDRWVERWVVTNGDNPLGTNAKAALKTIPSKPIKILVLSRDIQQELNALQQSDVNQSKTEMQNEVVESCVSTLKKHYESDSGGCPKGQARGRLILPCGTGKTRISLRIVEELTPIGELSVVLCPSIALVAQIRREYLQHCNTRIDSLIVCSDQTAGITKKDEGVLPENDPTLDTSFVSAHEIKGRVTTNIEEIAEWMKSTETIADRIKVLFGTYQSARTVADALNVSNTEIEVLIADEAHRTAGIRKPKSKSKKLDARLRDFTLCHSQEDFPAKYRVYQTATPRVYSTAAKRRVKDEWVIREMDDETEFGVLLERRSYTDAVKNGWLCDYRIIAIGVNDDSVFDQANKLASMARSDSIESLKTAHYLRGLSFALAMSGATFSEDKGKVEIASCIGFMNTIEKSKNMASNLCSKEVRNFIEKWFEKNEIEHKPANFNLRHLDASSNVTRRQQALKDLADGDTTKPFGILNVGIFGEGTDSPGLNAVAFLEPRKSPIDVIQAVGRVMRTAPGKETGYIICPILIPPHVDPEDWLSTSTMPEGWSELGEILLALRAHDGRVETDLAHLLTMYLPAEPTVSRNLVGLVNEEQKIEYYEHEGKSGTVDDAIQSVMKGKSTARRVGLVKLANRRNKSWKVPEPGMLVTGRIVDENVEIRVSTVERKDGTDSGVDLSKCKNKMRTMINDGAGLKRRRRKKKDTKGTLESAGLRLLRLSDAMDHETAIQLNLLKESGLKVNRVERDLNILKESVNEAARHLDADNLEPILAQHFGFDQLRKDENKKKKRAKATTVASLIFMNAAMMQSRIDDTGYIDIQSKLVEAQNHPNPIKFLSKCWNNILRHDYQTVFEPAVDLLDVIEEKTGRRSGLERALHHIAGEAHRIAETYADMGMDHAGPLFNRVMGDQSSDGAFFTRPLAAVMLASLALDLLEDVDWTNEKHWRKLKIVDLACGSGTLLTACLAEMRRRARSAGASGQLVNRLHRIAVENVLKGFDINPISLQLAAAQMSIGNAEIRFSRMGLHRMPYGYNPSRSKISAGSLEFLSQQEILPTLVKMKDEITSEEIWKTSAEQLDSRISTAVEEVKDASIVIMNPPFTNREKMGEKFTPIDQKALRQRIDDLQDRVEKNDHVAGKFADKNSVEPLFTYLGDRCLHDNGILAEVVPTISFSASSAVNKRRLLASRFHIHTIVTCHRPKQTNMSQHSSINESLIVMRKHSVTKPPTRFVSLDRFPSNDREVVELSEKLSYGEVLDNDWGTISYWPSERIKAGDWSPGIWRDPNLAEASFNFSTRSDFISLGSLDGVKVHETGRVLRGDFKPSGATVNGSFPIVKSTGEKGQQIIQSTPDEYWISRYIAKRAKEATSKLLAKAGFLLITAGQRIGTSRLNAVVGKRLVGNGWMPVTGLSVEESKALGVFLNSTLGRLLVMRNPGMALDFPTYSASLHSQLMVPNIRKSNYTREVLTKCFDETSRTLVPQFRDGECDVRIDWDRAVERAIGLDVGVLDDIRSRLHKEPSVSGIGYNDHSDADDESYPNDEIENDFTDM